MKDFKPRLDEMKQEEFDNAKGRIAFIGFVLFEVIVVLTFILT